jgi:hypothetical protein
MASEPNADTGRKEQVHCNQCGGPTWHDILTERFQQGSEDVGEGISIEWVTRWTTLECRGCEAVCLRKSFWLSEWGHDALWDNEFFPPPTSRRPPRWFADLPEGDRALMAEIYAALHAGSRRLTLMGARAMVDVIMQRHVGDLGSFERQLAALQEDGIISDREHLVLEAALDAGSAAAHRGHAPSIEDAETVIDVVENMLQADRLTTGAQRLRERTPPRQRGSRPRRRDAAQRPSSTPGAQAGPPQPVEPAPDTPSTGGSGRASEGELL